MKQKLFKINLGVLGVLGMLFIILNLSACDTDKFDSDDLDGKASENKDDNTDNSQLGAIGELGNDKISLLESDLSYSIKILEGASNSNKIHDSTDVGMGFSVYNEVADEDKSLGDYTEISISIAINKYTNFQNEISYEFSGSDINANINYETENGNELYIISSVQVNFTKIPSAVGQDIVGSLDLVTESGDSLTINFNEKLGYQIISYL